VINSNQTLFRAV